MQRLAIIGTGMAGMSAAYFLKDSFDVTVYEKDNYVGGHTNTIDVFDGVEQCPMDTGFMVFNDKTYPNMVKLFNLLGVPYRDTDMSFSVRNDLLNLEYNGSSLNGLFAQKRNLLNPPFLKMLWDILKFHKHADQLLNDPRYQDMSLRTYIKDLGLGSYFYDNFLVPMSSAVWSTPVEKMDDFPARSLVRFFKNHGFVEPGGQLQWKTVNGGSREYRNRLIAPFKDKIKIGSGAIKISTRPNGVNVKTIHGEDFFDKVIIATHADTALELLQNPTDSQVNILKCFSYQKNEAIVHTDEQVMPKLKSNWSSWNFIIKENQSYTVYYMNKLQGVSKRMNFFININGGNFVNPEKIIQSITYHHPLFDVKSANAQNYIDDLNKAGPVHFTGSYYRYGFHEDALLSSVNLCSQILGRNVL